MPPREIIVVIDHNPHLEARAREHLADIIVLANHHMRGLSGARNSGIACVQGDIVAFLDDDASAAPDWIEQLLAGYSDPNVVAVGGAIEPLWLASQPVWFPAEFNWVVGCTYRGLPETSAPIRNLIGANMSFRRDVFTSVGLFHQGVGQVGASMLRCDDTEFCIRVRQALPGREIVYQPRARVYHQVSQARVSWNYFRTRCYTEGMAKALVARMVGANDGLASERTHVLRTLPQGVVTGILDTILHRDPSGVLRAGAIVAGLSLTVAGYLMRTIADKLPHPPIWSRASLP